ncbi:MAG: hypothetical protein QNJ70_20065 [Xenococcaceae cyanobacterium MO_207.B15]|nr:hypothetical protein [Xenococcaceae cyanobacterium MO_207.B15]
MVKSENNLFLQQAKQEKAIYEYLRNSVKSKSPPEMLREFRYLCLELRHSNQEISQTLEKIIFSKHKEDIFLQILNYCCHILIDYWSQKSENYPYILELIELFDQNNFYQAKYHSRPRQKLAILVQNFSKTEEYLKLRRIAKFINTSSEIKLKKQSLIEDLLPHYPYLYSSVLLGREHIPETTNLILNLQRKSQKNFESQLAQHIIYRSRLVEIARAKQLSNRAGKIIKRVENPTFLGETEFKKTLKQYLNKIDEQGTIYQNAKKFLIEIKFLNSYKEFKQSLYKYLIFGIKQPTTSKYSLQQKLRQVIDDISYQSDSEPCSKSLILQTCQRLLRSLVLDTTRQNNHYQLIELIMNLGVTQTAALMIKIILISPQAKSDLEQRLGILFSSYESHTIEDTKWLIKFLENILIAFSLYYGNINLLVVSY